MPPIVAQTCVERVKRSDHCPVAWQAPFSRRAAWCDLTKGTVQCSVCRGDGGCKTVFRSRAGIRRASAAMTIEHAKRAPGLRAEPSISHAETHTRGVFAFGCQELENAKRNASLRAVALNPSIGRDIGRDERRCRHPPPPQRRCRHSGLRD